MPRKFLTTFLPDRETLHARLHGKWYLRPFDYLLHDPALWYIGRRCTCQALALGAFICCLPIPGHMVMAVLGALYWRINMPVAVAAVWINNPLSFVLIYTAGYKLGHWLLYPFGLSPHPSGLGGPELARTLHTLESLLLGCVVEGLILALLAYTAFDLAWRFSIRSRWRRRQKLRRGNAAGSA